MRDDKGLGGLAHAPDQVAGSIEQMSHVLESGIGREMDSIRLELWMRKRSEQQQVAWPLGVHDGREHHHDLVDAVEVPNRGSPVHRRADDEGSENKKLQTMEKNDIIGNSGMENKKD